MTGQTGRVRTRAFGGYLPWREGLTAAVSQRTVARKECCLQMLDLSSFPEEHRYLDSYENSNFFLEY